MTAMSPLHKLRLLTIGALIVLVFLLISFLRVFFKDYELRQEIGRVQGEVNTLEKRKIESLDVLQKLQSDAYVEERARAELPVAKPNEDVVVVPGAMVTSSVLTPDQLTVPASTPRELSNSEKWWYYFFRPTYSM